MPVDARMTATQPIPDRLVVSVDDRRPALLDVISQARRRITLSLFRCNDEVVFEALKAAADRGVVVEVLITSRAKGGPKKMAMLWSALEQTGASLHAPLPSVLNTNAFFATRSTTPWSPNRCWTAP